MKSLFRDKGGTLQFVVPAEPLCYFIACTPELCHRLWRMAVGMTRYNISALYKLPDGRTFYMIVNALLVGVERLANWEPLRVFQEDEKWQTLDNERLFIAKVFSRLLPAGVIPVLRRGRMNVSVRVSQK